MIKTFKNRKIFLLWGFFIYYFKYLGTYLSEIVEHYIHLIFFNLYWTKKGGTDFFGFYKII